MDSESRLALLGFGSLGAATVVALLGNALWWPLLIVGGLLLSGALNLHRSESVWYRRARTQRRLLRLYAGFLLFGLGQELVGRLQLNIWSYQGIYATWAATVLLIVVGYPLFFLLIYETFVALSAAWGSRIVTWVGTVVLTFIWSELPNQIAPLYDVNPPYLDYRIVVFGVGYLIQTILAVAWYRRA